MTTNPWLARLLRRSDSLLDGTAPAGDPVARLLADAARRPEGPLTGEDAAVAAFRWSRTDSPATPEAGTASTSPDLTPTASLVAQSVHCPPRSSMRTVVLRRLLATKVLAIGLATATVGGVAFAASLDVLKLPFQPVSSTLAGGASAASRSGGQAPGTHPDGDADHAGAPGQASTPRFGPPSTSPTPSRSPSAKGADKAKEVKAMANKVRLAVDCQIWTTLQSSRNVRADLRDKVTKELTAAAGSKTVLGYCKELTGDLCREWPMPRTGTDAKTTDTRRRSLTAQCPFSLDHRVTLPKVLPSPLPPVPAPTAPVKVAPSLKPVPEPIHTFPVQPVSAQGPVSRA